GRASARLTRRNILIKKIVAAVGKAGGSKWKSLSGSGKAPYVAKADKRKVEYKTNMEAYNKELICFGTKENEESVKPVCEENNVDDPEAESWVRRS
ncbi:unnamed protein product, partial [Brassica oleracea]